MVCISGRRGEINYERMSGMLEKTVEQKLKHKLESAGCIVLKLEPTIAGIPDRLVIRPDGKTEFIELKQDRGTLRRVQQRMIKRLQAKHQTVHVLYGAEQVDRYCMGILAELEYNEDEDEVPHHDL